MNSKTKKTILLVLPLLFLMLVPFLVSAAEPTFDYTPIENLPLDNREATAKDFYDYIQQIYNFLIGAAGVCAVLMIVIGGFMYLTSAGNNSKMEKAKEVITDAIIGLLMVMFAWLLLYLINPDLVNIKRLTNLSGAGSGAGGGGGDTWKPGDPSPVSRDCPADQNNAAKAKLPTGITTKANCPQGSKDNCVNLCGINDAAFTKLSDLNSKCGGSGKEILVTAGTENHTNSNGANTFDIRCASNNMTCNQALSQCVIDNYGSSARQICSYDDKYRKNCPASYYNEPQGLTHLDFGA